MQHDTPLFHSATPSDMREYIFLDGDLWFSSTLDLWGVGPKALSWLAHLC